jgi:hypothetical protein
MRLCSAGTSIRAFTDLYIAMRKPSCGLTFSTIRRVTGVMHDFLPYLLFEPVVFLG